MLSRLSFQLMPLIDSHQDAYDPAGSAVALCMLSEMSSFKILKLGAEILSMIHRQ